MVGIYQVTSGTSSPYGSKTVGKFLKATSGWNNNGNGTDKFGFSALPSGFGNSGGYFNNVGNHGNWWGGEYYSNYAYSRNMDYTNEYANYDYYDKSVLFSVRCLQDVSDIYSAQDQPGLGKFSVTSHLENSDAFCKEHSQRKILQHLAKIRQRQMLF